MKQGWENYEPAPIEFFHGRLLELFHQFRKTKTNDSKVEINGTELNDIIAAAKNDTFTKYPQQNLQNPIPKSKFCTGDCGMNHCDTNGCTERTRVLTEEYTYVYDLEYSEKQGFFHFADKGDNYAPEYKLICRNLSYSQCYDFTQKMFEKYPKINSGDKPCPTFEIIKKEFELFIINPRPVKREATQQKPE